MTTTTTVGSRTPPALLPSIVVAIVLGILGMHALTIHGAMPGSTHHADAMHVTTGADASASDGMPGMLMAPDPSGTITHDKPSSADPGPAVIAPAGNGGHDMGAMVMLCVAMLAAAAITILAARARRRSLLLWAHRPASPTAPRRVGSRRMATGPPPVWEYSVIRC